MGKFESFEDIKVWQLSQELALEVYQFSTKEKFHSDFDLARQMRRAAVSVPSNIAEGFERKSNKEFARFLYISKGSVGELRSQLYLARELKYVNEKVYKHIIEKCVQVSKMLGSLIKYLNQNL